MSCFFDKFQYSKPRRIVCAVLLLLVALSPSLGGSQEQIQQPAWGESEARISPAQRELQKRIQAANDAQKSGDPAAIADANQRLLAVLLRLMGQLRVSEGAYRQGTELYRASLKFGSLPGIHGDLAMALQFGGAQDASIREAKLALAENPADSHIEIMLGRAYLAKKDYNEADKYLTKAARLNPNINSLYLLAVTWLQSGQPDGRKHADLVFDEMKSVAGDSGSLHVLMGRAYRDAGSMPDAVKQFKRAIQLDPSTPHAYCFLGLASYAMNEWQPNPQATADIQKELQYHPDDFLANYLLGVIESTEHHYPAADKYLKKAITLNPTWPELYLYLGLNAFAQSDYKTAEPMLREAVALTGNDEARSNYQIRRAYVDLGRILAREEREKEADVFIAKARDLENKLMHETQQKATAEMLAAGAKKSSMGGYIPLKKKPDQQAAFANASTDAAARLDEAVIANSSLSPAARAAAKTEEDTLRPILGQSYSDLATAEAIQHKYAEALRYYQAAEQWEPTISGLYKNLGQAAYRAGNYAEAARGLSKAATENPKSPALRALLGMSYFRMQRYGDAATAFYPLGETGMRDPMVGYAWAFSLARDGDLTDASQVLKTYQTGSLTNEGRLLVGRLWVQIGDYKQATASFQQILSADPSFKGAHYGIAVADIRAQNWSDARAELNAELAIAQGEPDALYSLGMVDVQESKNADAERRFEQVIQRKPDYADAQYELGKLLMGAGKAREALPHLDAAAQLTPDKAYVHYQLQAAYRKLSRTADADRELAVYEQLKAKSRAESQSAVSQTLQQRP